MTFIFIGSYLNVTCVIDVIEHEGGEFRILTEDKGLVKLFSELYGSDSVIEIPRLFSSFINISLFTSDFIALKEYKKNILEQALSLKPSKIILFYIGWYGFASWLIKKLSKNTAVYYRPKVNLDFLKNNYSIRNLVKTFIASLIYGIKFKSSTWYGNPMVTIDKSFLKIVGAQKYDHIYENTNVIKFIKNKYDYLSHVKVLLLVGGEYNLEKNEYCKKVTEIYSILLQYFESCEVGIKKHPGFQEVNFEWQDKCEVLDAKIPANLLCYIAKIKIVIAYESSVLFEASDIGLKAISTAYIIPSTSDGQGDRAAQYLLDNSKSKEISFPQNIDEFNDLLIAQAEMTD